MRSRTISTSIRYNPDLEPETSRNATLGFILEPNRNFNLGVDYFYIQRDGENRPPERQHHGDPLGIRTWLVHNDSIFRNNDPMLLLKDANGDDPELGPVTFVARRRFLNQPGPHGRVRRGRGRQPEVQVEGLGNFNAAARVTVTSAATVGPRLAPPR